MPASDTSATTAPSSIRDTSSPVRSRSLCSWYGNSEACTP